MALTLIKKQVGTSISSTDFHCGVDYHYFYPSYCVTKSLSKSLTEFSTRTYPVKHALGDELAPEEIITLACSDNLANVIIARSRKQLNYRHDEALHQIHTWMIVNELDLAPENSEAGILKGQRDK
ncbi:hypothetical protein JTB14_029343 [Gonioctena quinquepunctata]|nr:hypothetical protein JTB14_029343 [Gonioctena quinquepunctata]